MGEAPAATAAPGVAPRPRRTGAPAPTRARLRALIALAESDTLEAAAREVARLAEEVVADADVTVAFALDGDPARLTILAGRGAFGGSVVGRQLALRGSAVGRALRQHRTVATRRSSSATALCGLPATPGMENALVVPLTPVAAPEAEVAEPGVICFFRDCGGFTSAERHLADEYGGLAEAALSRRRLARAHRATHALLGHTARELGAAEERLRDAHDRALAALTAVSGLIGPSSSIDDFFGRVSATIGGQLDASRVFFWRLTPRGTLVTQAHGHGIDDVELEAFGELPCAEGSAHLVARLVHDGLLVRAGRASARPGTAEREVLDLAAARTGLVCPWYAGERTMGLVFALDTRRPGGFTDEDTLVLRLSARAAGLVWQHRQAEERLFAVQAERTAQLEEHASEMRSVIDGALDAVLVMDEHGVMADANPAAEAIFGWSREQAIGRPVAEVVVPPGHRAAHREGLRRVLAGGETRLIGRVVELEAMRADGSLFPVELALSASSAGGRRVFHAFVRDISARRRVEIHDREQARRVAALEEAKTQLLNLASHELRGPVGVLAGYLSMLQDGELGELPPHVAALMPVLRGKVSEMNLLVDGMLEAARLEDGRLRLVIGPVDLRAVVRDAVVAITGMSRGGGRVRLVLPAQPVTISADAVRLGNVVGNLVHNALKYSPLGGDVRVELRLADASCLIEVEDHGMGIDPGDLDTLFTRFGRIVTPENSHIPGTGLGLFLARELARLHGGDITVSSRRGEGSVFSVQLPLAGAPDPSLRPASPAP